MTTRNEYMEALAVVEAYHAQLKEGLSLVENHTRVPLQTFLNEAFISSRLHYALTNFCERYNDRLIYLDEIMWKDFQRMRNVGPKLWEEFALKREKFMQDFRH